MKVQVTPAEFAAIIKGREDQQGTVRYWAEWPTPPQIEQREPTNDPIFSQFGDFFVGRTRG